uniref:Uncharacterized protein n=1 Tax=Hot spring virus BHS1 TaxID=2024351 RepID=A0A2U7P6C6_9VIRU|nr:hypothetical protein [Hot spring virus BHS1]
MIPDKIELRDLDPDKLTLDELTLIFDPSSLSEGELISIFRQFCLNHTNWTRRQIGQIKAAELKDVMTKISAAIKEQAVPKETPPDSEHGLTATT